jgi:SAM-dependent methyltransferase
MRYDAEAIERIIRGTHTPQFDANQLPSDDSHYASYVRSDSERCAHIINLLPRLNNLQVLEVGIGYGHIAIPLCKICRDSSVSAIEAPTREYVDNARFRDLMKSNKIDLRLLDISTEEFPFEASSFDVIIFSEIMEHLSPPVIPRVLGEIRRCLRVRGILILSTPNVLRLRNRIRFLLGKTIFESPAHLVGGTYGHIREYSNQEVIKLLKLSGFGGIESERTGIPYPILITTADRIVSRIGRWLARFSVNFEDFLLVRAIPAESE